MTIKMSMTEYIAEKIEIGEIFQDVQTVFLNGRSYHIDSLKNVQET